MTNRYFFGSSLPGEIAEQEDDGQTQEEGEAWHLENTTFGLCITHENSSEQG
jgi:hypothetical protein